MGFSVVRLDTNKSLTEAQALYRKLGYREIGRYNDNPYASHFFEKLL
jgi:ribosomal protein S18 acetylase RimI-like enzyme